MSMITEQVERLRTLADIAKDIADNSTDTVKTLREAADTIEQLAAIKTLEQEPCPDAISRQAAIDIVDSYSKSQSNVEDVTQDIIADIVALPSVNPQPKTGHWIRQDNTKEPLYSWYFCSECNSVIGDKTKFCSNCGAKMVEPQESEGTDADNQT